MLAEKEALILDPVYTGKAMAGVINLIGKGGFTQNESILFIHQEMDNKEKMLNQKRTLGK